MKPGKSSRAWMREHVNDPWVKQAKAQGYRSRAAFKLEEISRRDRLIHQGSLVIDLGAAPGGWSQYASRAGAQVIALDVLEMEPLAGVTFLQGDFTSDGTLAALSGLLKNRRPDLVISDMAPNISGISSRDQAQSIYLCELALDFAVMHLKVGGWFLVKVFQGEGFQQYLSAVRAAFEHVATRKPQASRDRSSEVYLLARNPRRPLQMIESSIESAVASKD